MFLFSYWLFFLRLVFFDQGQEGGSEHFAIPFSAFFSDVFDDTKSLVVYLHVSVKSAAHFHDASIFFADLCFGGVFFHFRITLIYFRLCKKSANRFA